jgi:hypothetical protein
MFNMQNDLPHSKRNLNTISRTELQRTVYCSHGVQVWNGTTAHCILFTWCASVKRGGEWIFSYVGRPFERSSTSRHKCSCNSQMASTFPAMLRHLSSRLFAVIYSLPWDDEQTVCHDVRDSDNILLAFACRQHAAWQYRTYCNKRNK